MAPGHARIVGAPEVVALEPRQQVDEHTGANRRRIWRPTTTGEPVFRVVIPVDGQSNLLEIVLAVGSAGCLAGGLHGWQQDAHERGNDRNHNEELDEGECAPPWRNAIPDCWRMQNIIHDDALQRVENERSNYRTTETGKIQKTERCWRRMSPLRRYAKSAIDHQRRKFVAARLDGDP